MTTQAERDELRKRVDYYANMGDFFEGPLSCRALLSLLDEADELEMNKQQLDKLGLDVWKAKIEPFLFRPIDAPTEPGHWWYEHEPGCLEVACVRHHQGRLRFLLASFADYFDIPNLEGERWWGPKIPAPPKEPA